MSLPEGTPIGLAWFVAWATFGLVLAQVIGFLKDSDRAIQASIRTASQRGLDELNTTLGRLMQSTGSRDQAWEGPITTDAQLEALDRQIRRAWRPLYRYRWLVTVSRYGNDFCMVHALAAIPAGGAWMLFSENDVVTKISLATFSVLLVPIGVTIAIQFWSRNFGDLTR